MVCASCLRALQTDNTAMKNTTRWMVLVTEPNAHVEKKLRCFRGRKKNKYETVKKKTEKAIV